MTTKYYEADRDLVLKQYCPQTDYLDIYNSSCRSSTQPSTISDLSEDDISFQLSSVVSASIQSSTAGSETGSFECIDVAMETQGEVYRGGTKTVPKRQIQLKRRDTGESQDSDKGEVMDETQSALCTVDHRRDMFMRQHSTPAALHQESHGTKSGKRSAQTEQKQRLQKSMSLDESSTKTKMASCIIKSVLSKKMLCEQNLQNSEIIEGAFASVEILNNVKNCQQSSLPAKAINVMDMSSVDSHKQSYLIQNQQVASTKTSQYLPYKQNSTRSGFHSPTTSRAEIAGTSENEERDVALVHSIQRPADRIPCDSAKGKVWSTTVGSSGSVDEQVTIKNPPNICNKGELLTKQQNRPSKALQKTDALRASQESQQQLIREGASVKETETGYRGEVKLLGQLGNVGTQGTFKAMAPVHIVRDVRRLVKNTYNLSFKNAGDNVWDQENLPKSSSQMSGQVSNGEACGIRTAGPDQKLSVKKLSPPPPVKVVDSASLYTGPKGCVTKATALHESQDGIHNNTGYTHITPQIAVKPIGRRGSQPHLNQPDSLGVCRAETSRQTASSLEPRQPCDRTCESANEKQKASQATATNSFTVVPTYYSSPSHLCQPEQYQCSGANDSGQNQGSPPRLQGHTTFTCTPPSSCVQLNPAGAPQTFMPPFFYTPNPMSYQAIQAHVGQMSFIQAPVLMQSLPQTQSVQLLREDKYSPPQPAGNREKNTSCPDTQQLSSAPGFMVPFSPEYRQTGTGLAFPEVAGGQVYGPGCRHVLMDPETGRCFYFDGPQPPAQPQRKMLFDPETCQFVEVMMPQQTTAVIPQPCTVPYHPLQFTAMYTPQCFSLQAYPQEMSYSGP